MIRIAVILLILIATLSAHAQITPTLRGKRVFTVCDLRSDGSFSRFHDEIATVTGELDATADLTLLLSRDCNQAVQLVESESLRAKSSSTLTAFRRGMEAKKGCQDERPLRVVVKGTLYMGRGAGDLLFTFRITQVVKVEFVDGRSLSCPLLTNSAPTSLHWLFPEPLDVEGRVVAYDWASDFFPGFENIHIEHLVVRLEKVFNGESSAKYVRVDFWGAPHLEEYRLPNAIFEKGHLWRMYLIPRSAASVSNETCQSDVDLTVTNVDENGKEIDKTPAFEPIEADSDVPEFRSLPCYVVTKERLSPVQ